MARNSNGLKQFLVWEHMTKGCKCESTVLSDAHTDEEPADFTRSLQKDIHCLKKHYNSLKQRLQNQIIVFKPEENGFLYTSANLNTVQMNERVARQAAFKSQLPFKEVTLELLPKDYLLGKDCTWHAHLDIHRMTQLNPHCAPTTGTTENKTSSFTNPSLTSYVIPSFKHSSKSVIYYSFPQKKNHLISEAARKLGLYKLH